MTHKKYQHIERFGTDEVEDIEIGTIHIFPKIDGTNSSIWAEKNGDNWEMHCGSRKRELSIENDNKGFMHAMVHDERIIKFINEYPQLRLFGEWLVPHALKTYNKDAWRKFYIFDVCETSEEDELKYLPYEEYLPLLEKFNLDYIPCMSIITNADPEKFQNQLEQNVFLIDEGKGIGEGIVIKNYNFRNKFGRQTWAKIITNEFKAKHIKEHGPTEITGKVSIESKIINKYITESLVEKTFQKIINEVDGGWRSTYIPRLLMTVYNELITEEMWNIVKKFKNPTINFKLLQKHCDYKIKALKKSLF